MTFKYNRYTCWACGASGSVIDFVKELYRLTPLEAAQKLNADFMLGLPIAQSKAEWERLPRKTLTEQQQEAATLAQMELLWQAQEHALAILTGYYQQLQMDKLRFAPQTLGEDFHPRYVAACQAEPLLLYLVEEAGRALQERPQQEEQSLTERQMAFFRAYGKKVKEIAKKIQANPSGAGFADPSSQGRNPAICG